MFLLEQSSRWLLAAEESNTTSTSAASLRDKPGMSQHQITLSPMFLLAAEAALLTAAGLRNCSSGTSMASCAPSASARWENYCYRKRAKDTVLFWQPPAGWLWERCECNQNPWLPRAGTLDRVLMRPLPWVSRGSSP